MPIVQAEGQFLLVFEPGLEDELEGTVCTMGCDEEYVRTQNHAQMEHRQRTVSSSSTMESQAQAGWAGCEE